MANKGAKGKYGYWISEDGLLLLEAWARNGATNKILAEKIGITESTLCAWMNRFPQISSAIKRNKEIVDTEVENALLKKALGFYVPITKHYKLRKVLVKDGVRQEVDELKEVEEQLYVAPEVGAQAFWLKNRKPSEWRDRREVEGSKAELEDDPLSKAIKGLMNNAE